MKNSITYLMEPFLTQYFLLEAICRGFVSEAETRKIYEELARIFCVPLNDETEQYYQTANSEQYKTIGDYSSYERLCRTIEFAESRGQEVGLTEIDRVILAQKRESMLIKSEIFKQGKNLTRDIIADTLLEMAMNGNIDAMTTLAYMEYHGICLCQDRKNATKRLSLCAKWNNLFGNLMGIVYDDANTKRYYDVLYTILKSSNQREVFKYICEFNEYNGKCSKNPIARIIEQAFGLNVVKRETYDRIFAKVAFSELVSVEDKEKLLLNKKKEAIVSLSEIPFDVERTSKLIFEEDVARQVFLERDEEVSEMFCSLFPAVNGRMDLYRTLLVAADDEYISEMYTSALKKGFHKSNSVIEVDASMLSMQDFAGAKENFILRGLSETKKSRTVFLINNCNEIGEKELDELMKLLDYEFRRKFKLLEPTVSMDLSDVVIVLFSSESNEKVKHLSQECDVVWTKRINDTEKESVIKSVFESRTKTFGCTQVAVDDDCKAYLQPFRTGEIIRIIDGALKKASYENKMVITSETLRTVSEQQNINRRKREFGYIGGAYIENN